MTRALYFDCFAGVSGDMIIGALIDLGVDFEALRNELARLKLTGYEIETSRVTRSAISSIKFDVACDASEQPARSLADIREIIAGSDLKDTVKARSIRVFERLAEAEAKAHATTIERVHFHEVGAVDSIIDVVGAMIALDMLGIDRFLCSPLRVGRGLVRSEHGLLPVPAPGTLELLGGVPVYGGELEGEFVTPTGAAIVTSLCEYFGPLPPAVVERTGYGAGSRDPAGFPNCLRVILGDFEAAALSREGERASESVIVIETNIDDMNPQAYGFVMERAFGLGALDVFLTPVQMKKGRPGVLLTVLCEQGRIDSIADLLLRETTTLGLRYYAARRRVLDRAVETVETEYGSVRVKVAREGGHTVHFQPEYEDCARIACERQVPLIEVQAAVGAAFRNRSMRTASGDEDDGER
ncbi:MAG TPA: nickel pincer cofactor biosynthesis protein LarC [Blastocatellia bacterium]|nr:nickel pincer cofactor biosynthesis protein LarC [Blastocatellia bacterium]